MECFRMINYNRLGYEIKRDLANFSSKVSKGLKRPQEKFVLQMLYGILEGNKSFQRLKTPTRKIRAADALRHIGGQQAPLK